jgi:hypothetical protein
VQERCRPVSQETESFQGTPAAFGRGPTAHRVRVSGASTDSAPGGDCAALRRADALDGLQAVAGPKRWRRYAFAFGLPPPARRLAGLIARASCS